MCSGVYWNQTVCPSVCVSFGVRNTSFCQSTGGYYVTFSNSYGLFFPNSQIPARQVASVPPESVGHISFYTHSYMMTWLTLYSIDTHFEASTKDSF